MDLVDEDQCDHKVLAVPEREPRSASILDLDGMPKHYLREIEHFFRIYKELEQKQSRIEGWRNAGAARALIQESRTRFLGRTNAGKTISAMP